MSGGKSTSRITWVVGGRCYYYSCIIEKETKPKEVLNLLQDHTSGTVVIPALVCQTQKVGAPSFLHELGGGEVAFVGSE